MSYSAQRQRLTLSTVIPSSVVERGFLVGLWSGSRFENFAARIGNGITGELAATPETTHRHQSIVSGRPSAASPET
jgi:hypothetical protein